MHPTDSSLLQDGVGADAYDVTSQCRPGDARRLLRDRGRSVGRQVMVIDRQGAIDEFRTRWSGAIAG
jgi:hypothetical protein